MACANPNYFLDLGVQPNGKRWLKMLPRRVDYNLRNLQERYGDKNILVVPCGHCASCIKKYRRDWSVRCEAEAKCHVVNCFMTLTYDEQHLVEKVNKKDLRDFIKALRNSGVKLRYFACGEYGEKGSRPHYHLIAFGYMPDDLKPLCKSKTGFWQYKSKFIEKIWHKGLCTIQEFEPKCAAYVAGYVDKKIEDKDCFVIMSTHPGIGSFYYRSNLDKLAESDTFVSKGGFKCSLPRYFEKVADSAFYDLSNLKVERIRKSQTMSLANCQLHGFENMEELYKFQGQLAERRKKYGRNL